MGIPTLIKTLPASGSTELAFVDGAASVTFDSTYDEYMFVFTDIHPENDSVYFEFQVNSTNDAGGDYDTSLITSTHVTAEHEEDNSGTPFVDVWTAGDLAQSANDQRLTDTVGNGADESCAGIMHLFSPSSTTYIKHFYARVQQYHAGNRSICSHVAGYINDASYAIDEIQFKFSGGNIDDGVIQMYGIA